MLVDVIDCTERSTLRELARRKLLTATFIQFKERKRGTKNAGTDGGTLLDIMKRPPWPGGRSVVMVTKVIGLALTMDHISMIGT